MFAHWNQGNINNNNSIHSSLLKKKAEYTEDVVNSEVWNVNGYNHLEGQFGRTRDARCMAYDQEI